MQRMRRVQKQHGMWLLGAALITALSLLVAFVPSAHAGQEPQAVANLQQSQIYNGDLLVKGGQVVEGDVNVYSGDVDIQRDGRIQGNLNIYSGDLNIDEGGRVDGNVTSWSGDIKIDGRVDGSVSAMAGDVEVGDSAYIGGDISAMAGHIKQRAGAEVSGNILRGPSLKLPAAPAIGLLSWLRAPQAPDAPVPPGREGFFGRSLGFVGRALAALVLLGLFVVGAAAIAALRPAWTHEVQGVLGRQAALSFATGLIANVLLLAVIGFLFITICLRPPGLLLAVGMLAFNVAGMAAVGSEIGGRLSERMSGQWTPTSRTALGVAVPGAIVAFLWAIGGCFGFFGSMGALLLGSFGLGAILVKTLNLGSPSSTPAPSSGTPGAGEAGAAQAPVTAAPDAKSSAVVEPTASAPAANEAPAANGEQWWSTATPEQGPQETHASAPTSALPTVEQVDPAIAPIDNAADVDFTRIQGIGPKLSQRLHAANIHSFADLAALPPETLAGILGWTSERLLRARIQEQATELGR
jgi:predicted flap endonuclease-1-like 5' DNA nuclease